MPDGKEKFVSRKEFEALEARVAVLEALVAALAPAVAKWRGIGRSLRGLIVKKRKKKRGGP